MSLPTELSDAHRAAASAYGRMGGRPRKSSALKQLQGTLEQSRERVEEGSGDDALAVVEAPGRDYVAVADGYVAEVLSGRQVCGAWVAKAAKRYRAMRAQAERPESPYMFVAEEAVAVCRFAEACPHVEGSWASATITLEPFQVWILVACYGFRVRATGRRLVTVVFFQVARKSAKSTLVAIAGLYHLAVERDEGAQVICGATTGQQARIVFGIMQKMVRKSAYLRSLGLKVFANAITHEAIFGNARPINSKSSTQDGLNPSFISLDESHAQTFELRDVLMSAMGARPDGMMWCPTTAGYDLTSVGYALRTTAMKILDGIIQSDHTFVVLYELDEADDWRDEAAWIKAAPMLGLTPTLAYVRRYCADAQQTPGMEGEFQTKICNRWLHSSTGWIPMAKWQACADPTLTLEAFARQKAWIGVDLAERNDIAALAIVFERAGVVYPFVRGYLPREVVVERARAVPQYLDWSRHGDLVLTDGQMTDYRVLEMDLRELCTRFDVRAIVCERYSALNLVANLTESGLPAVIETKNAKTFTPPAKDFEARIHAGQLRHPGTSFVTWQVSNACVERRKDGSLLPTKDGPMSPNKIDAVDAILLAMSALLREATITKAPFMFIVGGGR